MNPQEELRPRQGKPLGVNNINTKRYFLNAQISQKNILSSQGLGLGVVVGKVFSISFYLSNYLAPHISLYITPNATFYIAINIA